MKQNGGTFFQINPPGERSLSSERLAAAPSMFVWIIPQGQGERKAFTNYWLPQVPFSRPGRSRRRIAARLNPKRRDIISNMTG